MKNWRLLLLSVLSLALMGASPTPTPVPTKSPDVATCGKKIGMAGKHVNAGTGPCKASSGSNKVPLFKLEGKNDVVNYGPKLKYQVKYSQVCTKDDVAIRDCIGFSEDVCPDNDALPVSRIVVALNGPREGEQVGNTLYCGDEPDFAIEGVEKDVAVVTPARFRQLPILASVIASQPSGFSLRNGFAHIYASSKTQTFNINLDDQEVEIRAIPDSYNWSYGDGSKRTLSIPGEAVAEHSFSEETPTSHVYEETGDFSVGLTTQFRGEYSTEGGPWQPIPGTANVPSEPMPMSVWRTKKLLVDQTCAEDPDGPACDSPFLTEDSSSK